MCASGEFMEPYVLSDMGTMSQAEGGRFVAFGRCNAQAVRATTNKPPTSARHPVYAG